MEGKGHRAKKQSLKTQMSFSNRGPEVELGKLVRLPYIRKTHSKNHGKSLEGKQQRFARNSNKDLNLLNQTHLQLLTLQEIELCRDSSREKQILPKIKMANHLLNRERSSGSLHQEIKYQKSSSKLQFNEQLKDIKLGPIIGKGTYSIVRIGKTKEYRQVAVKTYLKSSLSNQDRINNLNNQVRILKTLHHPSILSFIDSIETQQSVSIVTQLLESRSLADYVKGQSFNCVSQQIARFLFKNLLKAISYLHSKGIIHRDIKMENILLNKDYKPKLIDFGFSIKLEQPQTLLYDFCGTPNYISPEIIQRSGYLGKPADIWALGILLFKIVTGIFPFRSVSDKQTQLKMMRQELKFPNEMSTELTNLLTSMLNYDYRKRPTAEEVLNSQWISG